MKRFSFWLLFFPLLAAAADQDGITFCSYNLRNYVRMEHTSKGKKLPNQLKPEKEIAALVKFITDIKPDVLGVSEIGQEAELQDLQRRLKEAGLDLPNTEYCHGGDPVRRIALLTRFPIKERHSQTELQYQMGDEMWPVQRGFLDVVLEPVEGFRLHCVGVHLKSKRAIKEADESLMRRNEAHLLRSHVDKILAEHPDEKLLVYGDCNAGRQEDPIIDIMGTAKAPTGLQDIRVRDDRNESWTHYWHDQDQYSRIDYFFVSQKLSPWIDRQASHIYDTPEYYKGSDHRPIVARIKIPSPAAH